MSAVYEARYEGIVIQAVLATVSVIAATLAVFKFGNVRATPKMMKILLVALFNNRRRLLHDMVVGTIVINNPVRAQALRQARPAV